MVENENLNSEMIREMVEDYWRTYIPMCSLGFKNMSATIEVGRRFEERIAATASLMPKEKADEFLQAIDIERSRVLDEYDRDRDALMRRLGIENKKVNGDGGGCFIATAVYGNYHAPEVIALRRFRDESLQPFFAGRVFIAAYYWASPPIAKYISHKPLLASAIRPLLNALAKRNA
jgi:hypothetical protein